MKTSYQIAMLLLLASLFFSGCTLHFKASDVELDSQHTPSIIKDSPSNNATFCLTSIDFAKS